MPWNYIHFKSIDSTSAEAHRRIQNGEASAGDVIYADVQTGGYGRRGRAWQSPVGNLSATTIIEKPKNLSQIPFVFGLALFDALNDYVDETQSLKLKWPNDILLDEAKLVGVLLEVSGDFFMIGCGVNLVVAPQSDQPVATLGLSVSPKEVLEKILTRFERYIGLEAEKGFDPIRTIWLDHAHGIGQTVTARFPDGTEKTGIFDNISHDGALIMRNNNESEEIPTADIFF